MIKELQPHLLAEISAVDSQSLFEAMEDIRIALQIVARNKEDVEKLFVNRIDSSEPSISPFAYGLHGSTIPIDKNTNSSHSYTLNGNTSHTVESLVNSIFEKLNLGHLTVEALRADIVQTTEKTLIQRFVRLEDTPSGYFPLNVLRVDTAEAQLEPVTSITTSESFLTLKDTPEFHGSPGQVLVSSDSIPNTRFSDTGDLTQRQIEMIGSGGIYGGKWLDGVLWMVDRTLAPYQIQLEATEDGADVIFRSMHPAGTGLPAVTINAASGVTVENTTITINDANPYVRLVYDAANTIFRIMSQ